LFWITPLVTELRVVFDKSVPVGVRRFLLKHETRTFVEMGWHPQLKNGELLDCAESAGFDLLITADQNIRHQQNLSGRRIALLVLGSNIWPIVQNHGDQVAASVANAFAGSYDFIEMPLRPKPERYPKT